MLPTVTRTLRYLAGIEDPPEEEEQQPLGFGQQVADWGQSASEAAGAAGSALGQGIRGIGETVGGYLPDLSTGAAPEPPASAPEPSPYDTDQPFRPTPRLGAQPVSPPIAEDVWGATPQSPPVVADPRDADLGPHEAVVPAPPPRYGGPALEATLAPYARSGEAVIGAASSVLGPAMQAYDAANEWLINNPVTGALNPQGWGRELAGTDQLYAETKDDQQRLEGLIRRFQAGDASLEPEIQALTASLNQRTQGDRASLLAAGERNPNKGAETLGQIVQAGAATALAPSLAAGPLRNVAGAVLDPLGQGVGAALELPGRARGLAASARGALDAVVPAGGDGRAALRANAARTAAADDIQHLGSGVVPEPPAGAQRRYHGTASAFDAADPNRFDENGLYGPGYYTTSDPRLASSYAMGRMQQGPGPPQGANVRPVDIPPGMRLLDADAPLEPALLERMQPVIERARDVDRDIGDELHETWSRLWQSLEEGRPVTNDHLLAELMDAGQRALGFGPGGEGRGVMTALMQQLGFDGIQHTGGRRVPLLDDAGRPIEHDVSVIFPGSVHKVRNALSGTQGGSGVIPSAARGLRADALNAAQGAVMGAASEDLQAQQEGRDADPAERARRALIGGGLAVAGGRYARPGTGQRLGAGVVPNDGGAARRARLAASRTAQAPPNSVADLADQVAAQTPSTPPTPAARTSRNVAKNIEQQHAAGVAPEVPTGPMPPPDAPPTWWDHAENWRYNLGLLSQLATGAVQAAGGLVEAIGGGTAEAIRLGVLRGQPEALPQILGEGIKAIPGGIASSLRTVAGQVPKALEAGSDYRPALGARERAAGHPVRGALADLIGTPGRTVTQAPDALWYDLFYKTGISQAAADEARRQAGGGLRAMPERARIQAELTRNPTPEIEAEATRLAQDATYKGEPGKILGSVKAVKDAFGPVGSFLMPFYNTIARIHERALEYTPGVGLLPLNRIGMAAPERVRPLDRRLAQQAVGGAVVWGGLSYAAQGGIRGPGPSNANEAQAMRDQGYTPNSTNVGGYWVPNTWFGPWGPILNEIGAVNDARLYDHGDKDWDDLQYWQKAAGIVKMSGRALRDYPAMDAAATVMQLFTNPTDALTSLVGEVGAQYVPGIVRTEATRVDPMARTRTRGDEVPPEQRIEETFRQRSGIGRQQLPVAQDILGRPVANPRQGATAYLPRVGQDKPDPIIQAYLDADLNIGDPPKALSVGALRPGLEAPELTPEEQRRWNTIRGEQIITTVGRLMASDGWATHDADWRKQALESRRTAAGEYATGALRKEIGEPEVRRRMTEAGSRKAAS